VSSDRKQAQSGLSAGTLLIASVSSLIAAVVGSKLWGGGTLIGAALTPVIVAVASEGLRRPAQVIGTVRDTRSTRYDPVAEGRRGLAEGDLSQARPVGPGVPPERRVHRAGPASARPAAAATRTAVRLPRSRRRLLLAVATGLVAFIVAGVVLTSSELVLGSSVVSSAKRTTYIPVSTGKKASDGTKTTTDAKTTTTPTTPTDTTTTTQPATTPTTTTPAQTPQANSVPAAPPPAQTAPAPSPAPNQPVPAPTTSGPSATPTP
jgi:hypothetical protein